MPLVKAAFSRYIYTTNMLYQLPHLGDTIYQFLGIVIKAFDV